MPIYEYKCADCGSKYEQIRRMSDADLDLECPGCKSARVARQLSSFATTSSSGSSAQLPMMGCGKTNCCAVTGGGCSTN
jgi:putative FmdB family regulatory protein